jgi:hypothetical protein
LVIGVDQGNLRATSPELPALSRYAENGPCLSQPAVSRDITEQCQ